MSDGANLLKPRISYFICATPRSGSYLLCDALWQTGVAGRPEEYFWKESGCYVRETHYPSFLPPVDAESRKDEDATLPTGSDDNTALANMEGEFVHWNVESFRGFLEEVIAEGSTPNGVFGAKVFTSEGSHRDLIGNLMRLPEYCDTGLCAGSVLRLEFPQLSHIFLTRRNKVRQAISLWRAHASNKWGWQPNNPASGDEQAIGFDVEAIDEHLRDIVLQEAAWEEYFFEMKVSPIVVVYEDLLREYESTVGNLLKAIASESGPVPKFARTTRQSDHLSEEFLRRYLALKREGSSPEHQGRNKSVV